MYLIVKLYLKGSSSSRSSEIVELDFFFLGEGDSGARFYLASRWYWPCWICESFKNVVYYYITLYILPVPFMESVVWDILDFSSDLL